MAKRRDPDSDLPTVRIEVRNRAALLALAEALGEIAADLVFDGEAEFPLTGASRREIVDK